MSGGIIPPRTEEPNHPGSPVLGTTVPEVPDIIRAELRAHAAINESVSDRYPAHEAVMALQSKMGWDANTSDFADPAALTRLHLPALGYDPLGGEYQVADVERSVLGGRRLSDLMDVVVPTIRHLNFLEKWKPFVAELHFIFVQDGDPDVHIHVPEWVDYEMYNRRDIEKVLGDEAWIISQKDASIRNWGFLLSRKPLVWSLDDDCLPAVGPDGQLVNAPLQHAINLLTPSTPYFYSTVYDPFRHGADFVRGYPYSLRRGVVTAVSHGLWMNAFDYDAPTQLLKVHERNERYVDAVQTVPKGVLYPLCSMNVAFNRSAIGPAFMQGLMGVGQPWARYDDMFSGWASKVVADHIGMGSKSGAPYVRHDKASNPFVNLEKEYMGLEWQEEVVRFMDTVQLSPGLTEAGDAYLELAERIHASPKLQSLSPYFGRLARSMKIWVRIWRQREAGTLNAEPSRASRPGPSLTTNTEPLRPSSAETTCGVITYVHNEKHTLPIWLRYYARHFARADMYVLDHNTEDGSTSAAAMAAFSGVNVIKLSGDARWMPHAFLNRAVEAHIKRMLDGGYKCALLAEVDDMIIADPNVYPGGLAELLKAFVASSAKYHRTLGYELSHVSEGEEPLEPELNWSSSLLPQRSYWGRNRFFDKPYLTKVPMNYTFGFHSVTSPRPTEVHILPTLRLVHLHHADKIYCDKREAAKHAESVKRGMVKSEVERGAGQRVATHYEANLKKGEICTWAHARRHGSQVVNARREKLESIEPRWKSVEI